MNKHAQCVLLISARFSGWGDFLKLTGGQGGQLSTIKMCIADSQCVNQCVI